jgi:hypothetical protein
MRMMLAALAVMAPAMADAEMVKAVVVYDKGCESRLIIKTASGYALAERYAGEPPAAGDVLVGAFDGYGKAEGYNLKADRPTTLYIEDYMLSQSRVVEQLARKCR